MLNLYNYEYSTALDRNLNNIDEELEQSIPKNKRYLLRDCGEDYEKMLDVLQKELAPTRDVVNSINLQLSKIKKITSEDKESDNKFVIMVETLEKMMKR